MTNIFRDDIYKDFTNPFKRIEEIEDRLDRSEIRFPFYSILDFGATLDTTDPDVVTKNTSAIQAAIDKVVEKGSGTVYVPTGRFVYNSVEIKLASATVTKEIYLTLKGERGAILRSNQNAPVAFRIKGYDSGVFETSKMIREISIEDIQFLGSAHHLNKTGWQTGVGIELAMAQVITMKNVMISGYTKGGLVLKQCWDSVFHHMYMYNCGSSVSGTDYNYALQLLKYYDNTNACHFVSCHFEHLPLMLLQSGGARHNYFTNCKFEHSADNAANQPPIYVDDAIQGGFSQCQFVKNTVYDVPFITINSALESYSASQGVEKSFKITESHFDCSTDIVANWLNINYTEVENCMFNRSDGAGGVYPFQFGTKCSFKNSKAIIVTGDTQTIQIKGNYNDLNGFSVEYKGVTQTKGAFLKMNSGVTNNRVQDFHIIGTPFASYDIPFTYLDTNIVSRRKGYVNEGATSSLAYGSDVLVFSHSGATTITAINYGYNGQTITVMAKTATITLQNGTNIVTKAGTDLALAAGKVARLTNIAGKWYEV